MMHPLRQAPHYIHVISLYLFMCGTNLFLSFAGHVAKRGASDRLRQLRTVNPVDYGPPDHHQDTCVNRGISRILRSRFNHVISESQRDTWLHVVLRSRSDERKMRRLWDHGPLKERNRGCPTALHHIERSAIFPINTDVLPF